MDKVSYMDHQHDLVGWVMIHAITKGGDIKNIVKNDDGTYDIRLTIGGVECSFVETIEALQQQRQRIIKEKAQELFDEVFGDVKDCLYDLVEDLRDKLDEEVRKRLEGEEDE